MKRILCLRECHYPFKIRPLIKTLLFLGFLNNCISQTHIEIIKDPNGASVCLPAETEMLVSNRSNINLSNLSLTLKLPLGIDYVPGSVNGAAEANITQLSSPVFTILSLSKSDSIKIKVKILANCSLFDTIDKGATFSNKWIIQSSLGRDSISSKQPYHIETPYLVIHLDPTIDTTAVTGASFKRRITVSNEGLGTLTGFSFEDRHDSLGIGSMSGKLLSQTENVLNLSFDAKDFLKIGNRDSFFDRNESIIITEDVDQTICKTGQNRSLFSAYWGCNGDTCQSTKPAKATAVITFKQTDERAKFKFIKEAQFPTCICSAKGTSQSLIIINTGNRTAENIEITLKAALILPMNPYGIVRGSVTALGAATITDTQYLYQVVLSTCKTDQLYAHCIVKLSELAPGEEVEIKFNYSTCLDCPSGTEPVVWYYGYSYTHKCVPLIKEMSAIDTKVMKENPGNSIIAKTLFKDAGGDLVENKIYTVQNVITFPKIITDQYLFITLTIPCPLRLVDTSFLLNGQAPISRTISDIDSTTLVNLVYKPQPFFDDTLIGEYQVIVDCNYLCNINLNKASNTQFYSSCPNIQLLLTSLTASICIDAQLSCPNREYDCGPCARSMFSFDLKCDSLPTHRDSVYSYLEGYAEAYRKNYGNSDPNDDRLIDAGPLDTNLAERKKLMTGDTLVNEFRTSVVIDDDRFYYDSILFMFSTQPQLSFDTIYSEIEIKDISANKTYHCIYPLFDTSAGNGGIPNCEYTIVARTSYGNGRIIPINPELLNMYGANLPADFKFEKGDSINAKIYCHISSHVENRIVKINFTYRAFFIDRAHIKPDPFSCMAFKDSIFLVSQGLSFTPDQDTLFICKSEFELFHASIRGRTSLENFFTREFRNTYSLDSLRIIVDTSNHDLVIDSFRIDYIYQHDTSYRLIKTQYFPARLINNRYWEIDPALLKDNKFDESYTIQITPYAHLVNCAKFENSLNTIISAYYINANNGSEFYDINSTNTLTDRMLYSNVNTLVLYNGNKGLNVSAKTIYSSSDKINWTFLVSNLEVPGGYEIEIQSKKKSLSNIKITSAPDLKITKLDSSFFEVRDIEKFQNYQLNFSAIHSYCDTDVFLVISRWICPGDSITLKDQCNLDTFTMTIIPDKPELMLKDSASSIKESVLCDTLPEIFLEVYNADKGAAFDVYIDVFIPPGTAMIPSSLLYSYPRDTTYQLLPTPISLGSNRYRWIFSDFIPSIQQDGLKGVEHKPYNSILLKMKLITSCDAVVNSYPRFFITGKNHCGDPINSREKNGNLIQIKGLTTPGSFSLNLQNPDLTACDEETTLRVKIIKNSANMVKDSLKIILPPGLHYKTNSIINIKNMPAKNPDIAIESGNESLYFALDSSLHANDSVVFTIKVNGLKNILCAEQLIMALTYIRVPTHCSSTQANCDVFVESGAAELFINQKTGSFNLDSFLITRNKDSLNYNLNFNFFLKDKSSFADSSICVGLYEDKNFNKQLDAADLLIDTFCIEINNFFKDGNYSFENILNKSRINSCNYLLSTLPKYCICNLDTIPFNLSMKQVFSFKDSLCIGNTTSIGISKSLNKKYKWTEGNVSCDTCSLISLIIDSTITRDTLLNYTLSESDINGCNAEYKYQIKVSIPDAGSDKTLDCVVLPGGSVSMSATGNGNWTAFAGNSGKATIITPASPTTSITNFNSAGIYHFIWTNESGCSDTVSITITSKADAGSDKTVNCVVLPGGSATMSATGNGTWNTLPGNPGTAIITAPTLATTTITTFSTMGTYHFVWTNPSGCKDTVRIEVSPNPKGAFFPKESCPGELITINAGNCTNYLWKGDSIKDPKSYQQIIKNDNDKTIYLSCIDKNNCITEDTFFIHPLIDTTEIKLVGDTNKIISAGDTVKYCIIGGKLFRWEPGNLFNCDDCPCVIITPDHDTSYIVTVTDSFNCPHVFRFRIQIASPGCDQSNVFLPNAFSPNQDGHNDILFVRGKTITKIHLAIYNRWGEKVFESFDQKVGWEGSFKGKPLAPDVFGYSLQVECLGDKKYFKKGNISLLK